LPASAALDAALSPSIIDDVTTEPSAPTLALVGCSLPCGRLTRPISPVPAPFPIPPIARPPFPHPSPNPSLLPPPRHHSQIAIRLRGAAAKTNFDAAGNRLAPLAPGGPGGSGGDTPRAASIGGISAAAFGNLLAPGSRDATSSESQGSEGGGGGAAGEAQATTASAGAASAGGSGGSAGGSGPAPPALPPIRTGSDSGPASGAASVIDGPTPSASSAANGLASPRKRGRWELVPADAAASWMNDPIERAVAEALGDK
jgi:hypothetical protein